MESVSRQLHEIGSVCFGHFTLKSGILSPIYVDLRLTMARPQLMMEMAAKMWSRVVESGEKVDVICGVPTGAIPLAMCLAVHSGLPMIFWRKEIKDYGRKRPIEGKFEKGQRCLVVEDVFVSGQSTMETIQVLTKAGLEVKNVVVFLDREQGGKSILQNEGVKLHSAMTMVKMLEILNDLGLIDQETRTRCYEFLQNSQVKALPRHLQIASRPKKQSYKSRAELSTHPITKKLFEIMAKKETNLALSADVTSCTELLKVAEELGPFICILKTHVDILEDFSMSHMTRLTELADKYEFLIFEDRKFADIGNTVRLQYEGGMFHISEWSHIINAHAIPGTGVIQGLKNVGQPKGQACVLVAEMSSVGHLCTQDYIQKTVEWANRNKDFVIGFICQSYLTSDPEMIHMVPGVRLEEGSDGLGQGYITPQQAFDSGADLVIIGRGILQANDRVEKAKLYQTAGYNAYVKQQ